VEGPITEKALRCLSAERARGTKSSPRAEERRARREARSETGLQRSVKYDGAHCTTSYRSPDKCFYCQRQKMEGPENAWTRHGTGALSEDTWSCHLRESDPNATCGCNFHCLHELNIRALSLERTWFDWTCSTLSLHSNNHQSADIIIRAQHGEVFIVHLTEKESADYLAALCTWVFCWMMKLTLIAS